MPTPSGIPLPYRIPLSAYPIAMDLEGSMLDEYIDEMYHLNGMYISESLVPLLFDFPKSGTSSSRKCRTCAPETCRSSEDSSLTEYC